MLIQLLANCHKTGTTADVSHIWECVRSYWGIGTKKAEGHLQYALVWWTRAKEIALLWSYWTSLHDSSVWFTSKSSRRAADLTGVWMGCEAGIWKLYHSDVFPSEFNKHQLLGNLIDGFCVAWLMHCRNLKCSKSMQCPMNFIASRVSKQLNTRICN